MTTLSTSQLLDESIWRGQVFSGGWPESHGGTASVDEPATGNTLGEIGIADAEDVPVASRLPIASRLPVPSRPPVPSSRLRLSHHRLERTP